MAWERIAERRIREAMNEGKFEGVGRAGAVNLDEYFKLPHELRVAYSVLKSAGCVPEEVELLRAIDRLRADVDGAPDGPAREHLKRALADATLKLDLALERTRRSRVRDV